MLENEDLRKEEQEEVEADEVKKSKIKSGLSVEVKQLIEKYEREAKALNKSFINFASENKILYVLRWIQKESKILPLFCPIYDLKENRKMLDDGNEEEFIASQTSVAADIIDLIQKEETVLYPTSLAMITEEEFEDMKSGDREIGFTFGKLETTSEAKKVTAAELSKQYNAVVICTGTPQARDLPIAGRNLKGVYFALEMLSQQNVTLNLRLRL